MKWVGGWDEDEQEDEAEVDEDAMAESLGEVANTGYRDLGAYEIGTKVVRPAPSWGSLGGPLGVLQEEESVQAEGLSAAASESEIGGHPLR